MSGQPRHNTRLHAQLIPSFLSMNATYYRFVSYEGMAYNFVMLSMGVCTTSTGRRAID